MFSRLTWAAVHCSCQCWWKSLLNLPQNKKRSATRPSAAITKREYLHITIQREHHNIKKGLYGHMYKDSTFTGNGNMRLKLQQFGCSELRKAMQIAITHGKLSSALILHITLLYFHLSPEPFVKLYVAVKWWCLVWWNSTNRGRNLFQCKGWRSIGDRNLPSFLSFFLKKVQWRKQTHVCNRIFEEKMTSFERQAKRREFGKIFWDGSGQSLIGLVAACWQ